MSVTTAVMEQCGRCDGNGGRPEWPGFTCFRCRGAGQVTALTPEQIARREREEAALERKRVARLSVKNRTREQVWARFGAAYPEIAAQIDGARSSEDDGVAGGAGYLRILVVDREVDFEAGAENMRRWISKMEGEWRL